MKLWPHRENTNAQLFDLYKQLQDQEAVLITEIRSRDIAWQHLADNGLKVQAILAYREKFQVTLMEAKTAIETFLTQ